MDFNIPTKENAKLRMLIDRVTANAELVQLWKCANINAIDRSGINDHGEVHIRIVSNAALRILRLLVRGGVVPSVVKDYGLTADDAEVVVVLASCLHDVGIAVHRDDHEQYSLIFAYPKSRELLSGIYEEPDLTTLTCEVMNAIISHDVDEVCLTIEAGVVKVADALDMAEGRSRIPFDLGKMDIHSVSAMAVESVDIEEGTERPVRIDVKLANSAGIFQVDELLRRKLQNSSIKNYVEISARIEGKTERRLIGTYRL
ncbi:MAG TPA: HD domain-containing protein [Deltaproteobacteria bacterium]|jgi:hypothetical protein|nr:HD domain-containing protein [Deltaproteobacteria bacterium]HQH99761.1 HD domain-containing protein [Deltaproteobacteria bacterium]